MKRFPLPLCSAISTLLATTAAPAADEPFAAWKFRQEFAVPVPGLVEIRLQPDTLDAALPNLADLRVLNPEGTEMPYFRPGPPSALETAVLPRSFQAALSPGFTHLAIEVPEGVITNGITLSTPATTLLKGVAIETSGDGQTWTPMAQGLPVFRQAGAENLRMGFPPTAGRFLRLEIDDRRTAAIPFTAATLHRPPAAHPTEPVAIVITERTEMRGQTRLDLQLPAAHLSLASLGIETDQPLFMRRLTLQASVVEPGTDEAREVVLATGTVYRIAVEGAPPQAQLELPLSLLTPVRNLVLLIEHGDSPPLPISAVRGTRRPVPLRFLAHQAGTHTLVCGHPSAQAPRYDLAALDQDLPSAAFTPATPARLAPNPRYAAPLALPDIPTRGAPQEVAKWAFRKSVSLLQPGLQQLELDPAVLGRSGLRAADLRLMDGRWQVPYLLERTSLLRTIAPTVTPAPDPKRPRVGRWELTLPVAGLPAGHLHCSATAALFDRSVELLEETTDSYGQTVRRPLGSATWRQSSRSERPSALSLALTTTPLTNRWLLEIDNRDNAPLEIERFEATYPAIRLLFKTDTATPLDLYYGNPEATSPRYDLTLAAAPLLNAAKSPATAGPEEPTSAAHGPHAITGRSGLLFWSVLALVVVALLFIVARLLPKAESTQVL